MSSNDGPHAGAPKDSEPAEGVSGRRPSAADPAAPSAT